MEKRKVTDNSSSTEVREFDSKGAPFSDEETQVSDEETQVFQNPNLVDFDGEDIIIPRPTEKKKKVGSRKSITITFRENRTFELQVGQETMRFEGRETRVVDKELLKHPAFIQARKYFNIKGI